ncbi:UDP-N-acetylmuramate dehydrogenase [Propionivibrio dicarboxylicus]|uniref:UDP-N-acetylenolpyruvoylglucosamine reductase n=1 Tax=Propionivibrio dicarboxylicus TaxID=83767 RepID=A0A1G7VS35_9RHOO|nr:UDP-N-acetylmuramate dehydrogenase [Propionivibrio dicarboxylicus]SDG62553.1 UDP-N-acetylmuramate dehydrogenase [Propionivibrio dicarboxylicus]
MTSAPRIRSDVDLATHTTLALPGKAARFASITRPDELEALARSAERRFVLGGGSNVVLTGDFPGLILHMAIRGRALASEDADAWYVRAGAGEPWHDFVQWTLAQGWPGLENLSLIPGTVGAAPVQNIGAYGLEVGERLHCVSAIDMRNGQVCRFDRDACRLGYRDSRFKQEGWHLDASMVITEVVFRLPKRWTALTRYADIGAELDARKVALPTPAEIADAVSAVRRRKLADPAVLANAGSFFQNPIVDAEQAGRLLATHLGMPHYPQGDGRCKLAAGWLIEQSGWKGRWLGSVGMYEKQALVLVNRGGARGEDVLTLMRAVQNDVRQCFGVALNPEPVFI